MSNVATPNPSKEILERLKSLDALPHFPEALMKLERAIASDSNISVDDIVSLVAQDPRMVTRLIELANSARYSMGNKVTALSDAIVLIGYQEVRLMAHAINYQSTVKRKPPFSDKHFLKHAFLSGLVAQNLAKFLKLDSGEAFLASLLRDIGIYLLATEDRDKYLEVIKLTDYDISKLPMAENKIFNTYHPLMSARLLQQWGFPVEVVMGVAFHHNPGKADDAFKPIAHLTFLSEQGVFRLGFDNGIADINDEDREEPSALLLKSLDYFKLPLEKYDELLQVALNDAEAMNF
ncbi:hypothetical protein THMIRHAM_15640 [Thiomicrorhabdus immobilis]|uniref:HDOD domain-containing protein n=1 Tax=Thiomicrorhabdus immobilis TaxID=2791037 RepID=A0ABM7MEE2_9GAMM|nr:HDOD domain-containing protein [Thiomicrorhabdus immobilis]BCN93779.1 hypothetical protein THMIRHAM_15640 [Thiomicrorhabdus immobilis]